MKNKKQNQKTPKTTQQIQIETPIENPQQEITVETWQKGMPLPDVRTLDSKEAEKLMEKLDVESAISFIENANPKLKYNLILASPKASEIVSRLSFEEIFFVVKGVDETNALELLELTTPEQFEGFLDLECWSKDNINLLQTNKWMAILMEMDDDQFIERLEKLDRAFVVGYLKKYLEVYKGEVAHEQFEPDEMTAFLSEDRRYLVRFKQQTPENSFIYELIQRIYRLNWQFFYELMEGVYWELETLLEEEAYENKVRRLADWGFPEYYDALDILTYHKPKLFKPTPKIEVPVVESEENFVEPPSFPMLFAPSDSLFLRAIKMLDEKKLREIQWETVYLANRYIVANRLDFSRIEEVFKSLTELHHIISIALESFAGNDPKLAADILKKFYMKDIFIKGYSLIIEKREMARNLLKLLKRWRDEAPQSLFDYPYAEFLEEITLTRPRLFVGILDRSSHESRDFLNLREIQAAEMLIKRLEILTNVFESLFPPEQIAFNVLAKISTNLREPTEIKFSTLFLTALANRFLGKKFEVKPIPKEELSKLIVSSIVHTADSASLTEEFHSEFFTQLQKFIEKSETKKGQKSSILRALKPFFEEFLKKYTEELGNLAEPKNPDPRFISCILIGK